jgi:hypothetical protein
MTNTLYTIGPLIKVSREVGKAAGHVADFTFGDGGLPALDLIRPDAVQRPRRISNLSGSDCLLGIESRGSVAGQYRGGEAPKPSRSCL